MRNKFINKIKLLVFLIFIYEYGYCQNQTYDFLISGTIKNIDSTKVYLGSLSYENQIILGELTVFIGTYNLPEITITVPCHIIIGSNCRNPVSECPDSSWIGKQVLIEVIHRDDNYFSKGKCFSQDMWKPSLTPDRSTFYFITKENLLKDGIKSTYNQFIANINSITNVLKYSDKNIIVKELDKIITDKKQYDFVKEWAVVQMNEVEFKNFCYSQVKKEIIVSYINNRHLPMYIRLKARDFYPREDEIVMYFNLLQDLKNSNDPIYIDKFKSMKDYYIKILNDRIEKQQNIINLINEY